MLNNIKTMKANKGFTIVELLIVIVVIAILAAITIVAYNGIQNRAKTNAGLSLANSIVKKLESYNAVNGTYPTTRTQIQGLNESKIDGLDATTTNTDSEPIIVPGSDTLFNTADITATGGNNGKSVMVRSGSATGGIVQYWRFEGTPGAVSISYGIGS